jgi:hypothetical protein
MLAALCAAGSSADALAAGTPTPAPLKMGVPDGFADLASAQEAVVDVFMGGRLVATAKVRFGPDGFSFVDPAALVQALPGVAARDRVRAALSAPRLDENRALVCHDRAVGAACRPLRPEVAAIVFDESRFRVELFVAADLLETRAAVAQSYLPDPVRDLSFKQALGVTLAGATGTPAQVSLTDTLLVGLGPARLRAGLGWQTDQRAYADTLAVELDRRATRLSAGLLWVAGTELTGRRKLLGLSLGSQFDTRIDRDQLQGTPLVVHLDERSRVDAYVAGRLVSSGLFEAGNQALDTGAMPEGSYEVVLRITPASGGGRGPVREERRMFTRSTALPPLGHKAWQLAAGALVDDSRGSFPLGAVTATPYVQAGWIDRLNARWAAGAGVIATDSHQLVQLRALFTGRRIVANADLLVSPRGEVGAYAHVGLQPGGRWSFDLDARAVATRDGRPLLPQATPARVWIGQQFQTVDTGNREAQVTGNLAYQLGATRLALVGSWRRTDGQRQYAVGPSLRMPILRRERFELVARGDLAWTERGRSGYVGLNLIMLRGTTSYSAEGGLIGAPAGSASGSGRDTAVIGNLRATTSGESGMGQWQGSAALGRDQNSGYAAADASLRGSRGEFAASLARALSGPGGTQYALNLRTGVDMARGRIALGRPSGGEAGVVARVDAAPDERFDLLVNDVPRASLRGGHAVAIDLPAYRTYNVRLRAAGSSLLGYDGANRQVTLFPGNVATFSWRTRPQLSIYARLVTPDHAPLAGAALSAGSNVADTGEDGGFLLQLDAEREITARLADGSTCTAAIPESAERDARNGFAALKDLVCQRQPATSLFDRHLETTP